MILQGESAALPYRKGQESGCDYCGYRHVCGFDVKIPGYHYRDIGKMTKEEAIAAMERKERGDGRDVDGGAAESPLLAAPLLKPWRGFHSYSASPGQPAILPGGPDPDGKERPLRFENGKIDRIDTCEEQDAVYVKVLDYKTGMKAFDVTALYNGLQLQLMVYMDAAVRAWQKKRPDKEIIPAGVFYYLPLLPCARTAPERCGTHFPYPAPENHIPAAPASSVHK